MGKIALKTARVRHERIPIAHHVKTAFGVMKERHAVFVMIEDTEGRLGIGESWINFPFWAPWERVAAFEQACFPYLENRPVDDIAVSVTDMYKAFLGPARQSGTIGPLLQALCAVELALWDLQAQAADIPLAGLLFPEPAGRVRVYASGLNSPIPWDLVDEHLDKGVDLFKLKLGFGAKEDRENLDRLQSRLDGKASLAVDINRAWTFDEALAWLPTLHEYEVQWLEEPLMASEERHLANLRAESHVPISGGENVFMPPDTDVRDIVNMEFDILQPDLTKYTPLHVAARLLPEATENAKAVIPHFLGSGPGQAASLQFAAGCPDALVELDINRNPLRTDILDHPFDIVDGCITIPDRPGIGWGLKE